jgi:hypothetical protein
MTMIGMVRSAKKGGLRKLVFVLVAAMSILGLFPNLGSASVVPADEASKAASLRDANLAKVRVMLERKEVAAKLADYGLTPAEVSSRLDNLTDQQATELAARIDQLNAGGDSALGLLISLAVLVILVLLILWLLKKDVTMKNKRLANDINKYNLQPATN